MRKSIMAVVLITMLALAGTTGNAFAWSDSTTVPVAPGTRVCFTSAVLAQYQAHTFGSSDRGVRFTTHRSADGVTFKDLDQSPDDSHAFGPFYRVALGQAKYFPNYFRICARNLGAKSATVSLGIETDVDVH